MSAPEQQPEAAATTAPVAAAGGAAEHAAVNVPAPEPTPEAAPAATTPTGDAAHASDSTDATTVPPAPATEDPHPPTSTATATDAETAAAPPPAPAPADSQTPAAPPQDSKPITQLWALAQANGHPEIWGVTLADPDTHIPTQVVLQKYLNANDGDLPKAKDQLAKTLDWRAKTKPLDLVAKVFSKVKFAGLGYVTKYRQEADSAAATPSSPDSAEVFTWNIYGGVTSIDETFGNLEEFLEWRIALMELALRDLDISSATKPITPDNDPYKMFQVHDYKSISFLRQSPHVKAASAETIKVFAQNYPELLKEKFFVNVPAIMGFVYAFMKLFVAAKTIKKFHPMSNGGALALEFPESNVPNLGEKLPAVYGGKGAALEEQGWGPRVE